MQDFEKTLFCLTLCRGISSRIHLFDGIKASNLTLTIEGTVTFQDASTLMEVKMQVEVKVKVEVEVEVVVEVVVLEAEVPGAGERR